MSEVTLKPLHGRDPFENLWYEIVAYYAARNWPLPHPKILHPLVFDTVAGLFAQEQDPDRRRLLRECLIKHANDDPR